MKVDTVITLENNENCLLLEKAVYENNNYFLSVILNELEEPSEDYTILKEIVNEGEKFVERETNDELISELLKLFSQNFNKLVDELPNLNEEGAI